MDEDPGATGPVGPRRGLVEGKVALVSGIGPGMGREISLALAREGADLVLGARREKRMARVAEEVEALGRRAVCVPTDVTDPAACAAIVEAARRELGRLDVLVNNAFHDGTFTTLEESDLADWRTTMDVNLYGTLELTKAAVPLLKEAGDGRVVMINSMSALNPEPRFGAYSASKAALAAVTRTLARELGPHGIRVNGVHPGYIWGPSVEWYFEHLASERGTTPEQVYAEVAADTCLGYLSPASEIAGTVVFLASDLSRPVTGQAISVNCGHWLD